MRLARVDLISWGHFARASLDLSAPGLHLVYGPNEAGKSTARRAITALLFGVPRGTPDAFLLPKATDARVGGRVVGESGEVLELVRRGGQKNTLLTPREEVLSEEALSRLVGVGEATFSAVFSMDHDTLRQGAEAVLRVGGDVGESLAAAALGDARLSKAATRLRAREGELYNPSPNARKSQLHEALRAYKEARQKVDDSESDPAAYDEQRRHAQACRDAHEAALRRLAHTRGRRLRLEEIQRARPAVRERAVVEARLAELAHVPALRGGLEQEHSAIAQSRRQAEGGLEVIAANRETLGARAAERRPVAEAPLAWLEPLRSGLARVEPRSAHLERLAALVAEQGASLANAEPALTAWLEAPEAARKLLLGRAATLRHLEAVRDARRLHGQVALRAAALREPRAEEDPARIPALERALAALDTAMLLETRAAATLRELDAAARSRDGHELEAGALLGELFSPGTSIEAVRALDLPGASQLSASDEERRSHSRLLERMTSDALQLGAERDEAEAQLALQRASMDLPSEDDLASARARRDAAISELAGGAEPLLRLVEARGAVRAADDLADKMRREAHRVLGFAKLAQRVVGLQERARTLDEEVSRLRGRLHGEGRAELEAFVEAGVRVRGVDDLTPARQKLDRLLASARSAETAIRAHAAVSAAARDLAVTYGTALADSGVVNVNGAAPLALARELVTGRREELRTALAVARERVQVARLREAERGQTDAELSRLEASMAADSEAVRGELEALGLAPTADSEAARDRFDALSELLRASDARAALGRERASLVAEDEAFRVDVVSAEQALAQPPSERPLRERAARLVARLEADSRSADEARRDAEDDRALGAQQRELEGVVAARRREQAELFALASAPDEGTFLEVVRVAEEKSALELRRAHLDLELGRLSQTCSGGELVELVCARAPEEVDEELAALETEIDELEQQARRELEAAIACERGVAQYHTQDMGAARAAEEAEFHAARVRETVEAWLAERAARRLLERRIERYREESQGPVLARASAHFRALTAGAYTGVTAELGRDDRVTLHARRAPRRDGGEGRGGNDGGVGGVAGGAGGPVGGSLDLSELSDGTRDQLFLALRVASLERLGALGTRAPVVIDDALVHFDDTRSRAALAVLAGLADTHTVVYLTHHAHLVELARAELAAAVTVHTLEKSQPG